MKKEHLSANLFGLRDEHEVDEEEKQRRKMEDMKRKSKKVKKFLINHERNHNYETDSDRDPYAETVSTAHVPGSLLHKLITIYVLMDVER
jgi:hypothetical protein